MSGWGLCQNTVSTFSHTLTRTSDLIISSSVQWNKQNNDPIFFTQSTVLHSWYYWVQIAVHRRFIPRPKDSSGILSFPSLAICTNAARSCVRMCETYLKRAVGHHPQLPVSNMLDLSRILTHSFLLTFLYYCSQIVIFNSATVLALNLIRLTQLKFDTRNEITDIHKCIEILRSYESMYVNNYALTYYWTQGLSARIISTRHAGRYMYVSSILHILCV
jgi:hypothetical protein